MRQLLRDILLLACGAALGAVGFWQWQQGPIYTSGEAEVIDGDNLKIDGTNWRLAGLDAPELPIINGKECRKHNPPTGCVNASSLTLAQIVKGRVVICWRIAFDWRNRRSVGICRVSDIEINEWLLKKCLAGSPPNKAHRRPHYEMIIAKRVCGPASDS